MKEILVLTPLEVRYGFALVGVRQQETAPTEVWETLQRAMADPSLGVIAVDARLLETIDQDHLRETARRWAGVLVTLPAPAGAAAPGSDELQRLVRRALGYHVKLEP